ncbi:MAG: malate dehydrogenase [Myxococcota bacterium]
MADPLRVAVTGAAGNIGYSLLWRLAAGDCFGPGQPIILQLLEIPQGMDRLKGTIMELEDSAMPLVHGIVGTSDADEAFRGADAVFLVGSRPRTKDMNRSDLVAANGPIFVGQGKSIASVAKPSVKVITVGNPCNTNCLIARANAKSLPNSAFSAMTRLDENRAVAQVATKCGVAPNAVRDVFIWGNHADTMYPDLRLASVDGKPAGEALAAAGGDEAWIEGAVRKTVATRGKAIIDARGASSAASAASAAVDHMRDWWQGTDGRVVSMAIPSEGWYGVPEGLIFSVPVRVAKGGAIEVVRDLPLTPAVEARIAENVEALQAEREAVADLL